jgi:uncharacterized protein with gpF-like domain
MLRASKSKAATEGKALRPNVAIGSDFAKPTLELMGLMHRDILRCLKSVFNETQFNSAMDASTTSQARIVLNWLLKKWQKRFDEVAKSSVERMIARTVKNTEVTLGLSLKDVAENFKIDTSYRNEQINEVIKASTEEAAGLIKLIPQRYLGEVQGEVMRSITTGRGLADLVPYLTKRYQGNVKKAKLTALDQTRKSYQSISTARLKALGVKKFIWVHSGGGKEPRIEHIKMDGKEYSFDDPPVIGTMYGREVRGFPGDLPNCRCVKKPVITFDLEEA